MDELLHAQVERFLGLDVYPHIGEMPMKAIAPGHILRILQTVEKREADTVAINIRQWCSAIFRYAIPTQRADVDPAGMLKGVVERPAVRHKTPVDRNDFPSLLCRIDSGGCGERPPVGDRVTRSLAPIGDC